VKIAAGCIGKPLKEFPGQAESERAGHILDFLSLTETPKSQRVQAAPNQKGASAEVDDATGQAFIHRHVCFAGEWITGVKSCAVAPDTPFVSQRLQEGLAKGNPTIFHRVVGIDSQVTLAVQA
jgi:hypothetical protein